jgi:hypothetical protein
MRTTAALALGIAVGAGCASEPPRPAGIHRIVEVRDGTESVQEVEIRLDRLAFRPQIAADQIRIVDAKYGHDLRLIVAWSVSDDRKGLRVRFKPGLGDFGTGNGVTVRVDPSAIDGDRGAGDRFAWTIQTDAR